MFEMTRFVSCGRSSLNSVGQCFEGNPAYKRRLPFISEASLPQQVQEENVANIDPRDCTRPTVRLSS